MNRQEARQVLGVKARDSSELIREKYHAKIKLYYPDLHPSRESVRQCMEVIEAYAVLYDIAKQPKIEEDEEREKHFRGLFNDFWPIPTESSQPPGLGRTKKDTPPKLERRKPCSQVVGERGFYNFIGQ